MSADPSVTIAGAGALGLACALGLADAGCQVTVFDPGGRSASGVAAGMIAPVFEAVLDAAARPHLSLLMAARDLWPGFALRTGIVLDRSGALAVGPDDWLDGLAAGFGALNLRPMEIGGETARALAPGLWPTFGRALMTREDWRLDPLSALDALRAAAAAAGVAFRPERLTVAGREDVLVLAGGWSPDLARLGPELRVLSPIKGQLVGFADLPGAGACVRSPWGYGVRSAAGLTFGATMEPGLEDAEADPEKVAGLVSAAERVFDTRGSCVFRADAGVRAATPDGLPLAGWSEAEPGVMLAAGARRNGWLLAPLVAQIVTAHVTGRPRPVWADRMDPARFRNSLWG